MRRPIQRRAAPRRVRGSIAITAAIWLMAIVTALSVVDVGHVWWQRRHLQGVADMMALAAAQRLDDTCGGPQSTVAQIAASNGYTGTYTVNCGRFDTSSNTFVIVGSPYSTVNAINVQLNSNVNYWFMPMVGRSQQGVAVASFSRVVNVNAFTLGSTLASVQSGNSPLLNALLGSLLGGAVNLDVASYQALANAQVKLSDLAVQLNSNGANDIVQMLATTPTLKTLITAIANAIPASNGAQPVLSQLVGWAGTSKGGNTVPMDGSNNNTGLLDIGLENKNGASDATIDALDAIMVAAMVANSSGNGVAPINIGLNSLTTLPILPGTQMQVSLGQPPVLAVGEAGTSSTIARSSQIKMLLIVGVALTPPASIAMLFPGTNISITLPLYLAIGNGQATLTKTQCGSGVNDSFAQIQIQPSVLQACVTSPVNAQQLFNSAPIGPAPSCQGKVDLAQVTLVSGIGLLGISSRSSSASMQPGMTQVTFTGVGNQIVAPNWYAPNSNDLGQDLASVLGNGSNSVVSQLLSHLKITVPVASGLLDPLLAAALNLVSGALTPLIQSTLVTTVTSLLSTVVPPLLNLLGAQIGSATVTDLSLTCGNVQIVR